MDILISYNWLKEYVPKAPSPVELARVLSLHGPSVERVVEIRYPWHGIVVGEILTIEKHPDASKLQIAKVGIGIGSPLTIVCGAPNILVGQKVPVALPGKARIRGEVLEKASIRGVHSQGMLCSPYELEIGDDHSGIWIVPNDLKTGTLFSKLLPATDTMFHIEVTSNRPDLMSVVGIAREVGAITGVACKDPFAKKLKPLSRGVKGLRVEVHSKECPFYQLSVLQDVEVKASPLLWQMRLLQAGLRPINNVVDATNYVLLEYGQPSHAFSYASSKGNVVVRNARKGESFVALNNKKYELDVHDVLITNGDEVLGLAGVMGGSESGTTERGDILLETAVFDPVSIRRTMRRHQLYSDAGSLFEKGLEPMLSMYASLRVAELLGKKIVAQVHVKKIQDKPVVLKASQQWICARTGMILTPAQHAKLLSLLGFKVRTSASTLSVEVPWWRKGDMRESIDIVEEIARMYGYHKVKGALPPGALPRDPSDTIYIKEYEVKHALARYGYSEVITNPFLSDRDTERWSLTPSKLITLLNPLNDEMKYMRTSLLHTMMPVIVENEHHTQNLGIFELARVYHSHEGKGLPNEAYELVITYLDTNPEKAYMHIRGTLDALLEEFSLTKLLTIHEHVDNIVVMHGTREVGMLRIVPKMDARVWGLKKECAYLTLDFEYVYPFMTRHVSFGETLPFPAVKRDISFVLHSGIRYTDIQAILSKTDPLLVHFELFDRYPTSEGISWGIHLYFASGERTLRESDVNLLEESIIKALENKLRAYVRSKTR